MTVTKTIDLSGRSTQSLEAAIEEAISRAALTISDVEEFEIERMTGTVKDGRVDEYRVWAQPWGFDLADVKLPVHLWQGDADQMVPMAHAEDMAVRLPSATLHRLPGEGHVSIQHHVGEILDSLAT